ncbi:hypothetical protein Droror1_Dr00010815 [Drosera rotundifolia]
MISPTKSSHPRNLLHKKSQQTIKIIENMSSHTKPAVSTKKQQLVSDLHQPWAASSKQPRVYTVEPIHFRELVQQLTGNHHNYHQPPAPRAAQTLPPRIQVRGGGGGGGQATGPGEWCALSLLSPGSIAAMEQQNRAGV